MCLTDSMRDLAERTLALTSTLETAGFNVDGTFSGLVVLDPDNAAMTLARIYPSPDGFTINDNEEHHWYDLGHADAITVIQAITLLVKRSLPKATLKLAEAA